MAGTDTNTAKQTTSAVLPEGILRKTIIIIALNLVCYVAIYFVNAVLARVLPTKDYGLYGLIVNTLWTVATFVLFGFDESGEFFVSTYASLKKHDLLRGFLEFLTKFFACVSAPLILVSIGFIIISFLHGKLSSLEEYFTIVETSHPILLFLWIVPCLSVMSCLDYMLTALQCQTEAIIIRGIIAPLIFFLFVIVYYYFYGREHAHYALYAYGLSMVILIICQATAIAHHLPSPVWTEKPKEVRKVWVTYAIPILFYNVIYSSIDTSVMGAMNLFHENKEYLGFYMAITSISGYFLTSIMYSILGVFEVHIGSLWEAKDFKAVQSLVNRALLTTTGLSIAFCIFVALAGRMLLENFGKNYVVAYPALLVYTISACLNSATVVWQSLLRFTDNVKALLKVYFFSFIVLAACVTFGSYRHWSFERILYGYAAFQIAFFILNYFYVRKVVRPIQPIPGLG